MNKHRTSEDSPHLHRIIFVFAPLFFLLAVLVASLIAIQYPQTYSSKAATAEPIYSCRDYDCREPLLSQCTQKKDSTGKSLCRVQRGDRANDCVASEEFALSKYIARYNCQLVRTDPLYPWACKPQGVACPIGLGISNTCCPGLECRMTGPGDTEYNCEPASVPPPPTNSDGRCQQDNIRLRCDGGYQSGLCPGDSHFRYCTSGWDPNQNVGSLYSGGGGGGVAEPPPPTTVNNPPRCEIVGPTSVSVGSAVSYTATCTDTDGNLTSVGLYSSPTSTETWSAMGECAVVGAPGPCIRSQTFTSPGTYVVVVNGYNYGAADGGVGDCTGNTFQVPSPWSDCGQRDAVIVSVSNAPTCEITGPTTAVVGQPATYNATCTDTDGGLTAAEIFWSPADTERWTSVKKCSASGNSVSCDTPITLSSAGDYQVVVNGYNGAAADGFGDCTGNTFQVPSPWLSCGPRDFVRVTADEQACLQVITYAKNITTGVCQQFPDSCIPSGWTADPSCAPTEVPSCALKSRGDANCDGKVDVIDFGIWSNEFRGQSFNHAKFDADSDVDIIDFGIWSNGFRDPTVPHL